MTPWIKFIWHLEAEKANFHYKLLPTDCIDVILNLKSEMVYETDSKHITAPSFHVNGLRRKPVFIRQKDNIRAFGISFYPYGLYPFIHKSLLGLQDQIVSLHQLSIILDQKFRRIVPDKNCEEINKDIEQVLVSELSVSPNFIDKSQLVDDFLTTANDMTVSSFCRERAVSIKSFERLVPFYTGFTPKLLRNIKRFQTVGNQLSHQNAVCLTDIAYDNNFTDQTHFTKEFKRFSGATPRLFQTERITVKENVIYTYL